MHNILESRYKSKDSTTTYNKWIGKRLGELLEEKDLYNFSQIGRETGINRKKIERIIYEGREIEPDELEALCKYLGVSEERFTCFDSARLIANIRRALHNQDLKSALKESEKFAAQAIGTTERAYSQMYSVEVLSELGRKEESFIHLSKAFSLADKANNSCLVSEVIDKLLSHFFYANRYEDMKKFVGKYLTRWEHEMTPLRAARMNHNMGIACYYLGDTKEAARYFDIAVINYDKSENCEMDAARLKTSIAHIRYIDGDYEKAKNLLLESVVVQKQDRVKNYLLTRKDLARTLIQLNEFESALEIVDGSIDVIVNNHLINKEIHGIFLLMKLELVKKHEKAIDILAMEEISNELSACAAVHLMKYYREGGDLQKDIIVKCFDCVRLSDGNYNTFIRGDVKW